VLVHPSEQTVVASDNATFQCIVRTDPHISSSLQIYWRSDGRWIITSDPCTHHCQMTTLDGQNSLLITNVTLADTGRYVCRAITSVDVADATASLIVKGRFSCSCSTAIIIHVFIISDHFTPIAVLSAIL